MDNESRRVCFLNVNFFSWNLCFLWQNMLSLANRGHTRIHFQCKVHELYPTSLYNNSFCLHCTPALIPTSFSLSSDWRMALSLEKCVTLYSLASRFFSPSEKCLRRTSCYWSVFANNFVLHLSVSNTTRLMVNPLELIFSDVIKAYSVYLHSQILQHKGIWDCFQSFLRCWLHTGTSLLIVSSKTALKRIINETPQGHANLCRWINMNCPV